MNQRRLLITGAVGSVVAAIFCFTPVPMVLLTALGLSALTAWLDYLLLPALALFLGLTVFALDRRGKAP